MLINIEDYDLIKSTGKGKITRAEAKAKHSNLPEGGVWRTIKGSHVYIKDGKVIAGAGVGKTGKAIKLGKAHLAEHQAHIDKEASKKATAKKAPAKKAPAKATAKKAPAKATAKKTTAKKTTAKKPTAPKKVAPKKQAKPKSFEDMTDEELEQAVKHHNDTYFAEKQKRDKEISDLLLQHKIEKDELAKESQTINKMRMSKKRTALREEHEKKSSEALRRHNEEYSGMRKRHEEELAPFFEARKQSAEAQGKRQSMKKLHERVQELGGYSKVFEQLHNQLDEHHKVLNDGRSSEYSKEHAQRSIDRTHNQIRDLEEASSIHGKGEKAPAYTPKEPKPKRVTKPKAKNEHSFHRHINGQGFVETQGAKVDIHPEITTYVPHEKGNDGMYHVIEGKSGMSIGAGKSKKEATEKATNTVNSVGIDKVKSAIQRSVGRFGQSPSHQDDSIEKSLSEVHDLIKSWQKGAFE